MLAPGNSVKVWGLSHFGYVHRVWTCKGKGRRAYPWSAPALLGKFDRLIPLGINAYILIHFNNNW